MKINEEDGKSFTVAISDCILSLTISPSSYFNFQSNI